MIYMRRIVTFPSSHKLALLFHYFLHPLPDLIVSYAVSEH